MNLPTQHEFEHVRELAQFACAKAVTTKVDDCYNAADLHCTEVVWCLDDLGVQFWLIKISEASPDAHNLRAFIFASLVEKGYRTRIFTEW